jgi:sortase (surface protein transpeptidase)
MEKTVYIHLYKNTSGDIFVSGSTEPQVQNEPTEEASYLEETYAENSQAAALPISEITPLSLRVSKLFESLSKYLAIAGILILLIVFAPSAWYLVKGGQTRVSALLANTAKQTQYVAHTEATTVYQPAIDPSLPKENKLVISSIGIDGKIYEATADNYEDALKKGIWRIGDFGTPFSRKYPTILAAHRYGYLAWTNIFRRHNSFYNLPKLNVGDTVEVDWNQRRYVYEVYKSEEGDKITDYSADLILYTCEDLSSPVRVFKYARLLEI